MRLPKTSRIDQRDTHRLIPAKFADGGASVLTRLTGDSNTLNDIFELDNATNDRLLAESGLMPDIDVRELVFGISSYRIINAAFCHPTVNGRFNSPHRGAWYAAFEIETSRAEIAYHRRLWLQETGWTGNDAADYVDYLADFRAEFHDIRRASEFADCLRPAEFSIPQKLAQELLQRGSAGIVYPSVRKPAGNCLACFRPVLVTNVRRGDTHTFVLRQGKVSFHR